MAQQTIRDVVVQIGLKQLDAKLKVPETAPATKAIKDYEKTAKESGKKASEGLKPISKIIEEVRKHTEEARREQEELSRTIQDESIKASESFATAAEGALLFSRGITLLGVSADDDLAKVVESLAKVQAGIDLIKGTTQVFKGAVEGVRAYSAATQAAAASQAVLGASATATATSVTALTAVATPFVAVAGAAAVALGGVALAMRSVSSEAEAAKKRSQELDEKLKSLNELRRLNRGERFQSAGAVSGIADRFEDELRRQGDVAEQLAQLSKDRQASLARIVGSVEEDTGKLDLTGTNAQQFSQARKALQERAKSLFSPDALRDIERQRSAAISSALKQFSKLESDGRITVDQDAIVDARNQANLKAEEEIARRREASQRLSQTAVRLGERELQLTRERSALLKAQVNDKQRAIDLVKAERAEIERTLEAERNRLRSAEERIGRLSGEDKLRLKQISQQQAAGGKLNFDQAQFLSQTGIGSGLASDFFRQQGQQFGARNILKNLGEGSQETALQRQAELKRREQEQAEQVKAQLQEGVGQQGEAVGRVLVEAMQTGVFEERMRSVVQQELNRNNLQSGQR